MNTSFPLMLAQTNDDKATLAIFAGIAGIAVIALLVFLLINVVICYFISTWLAKVPAPHRKFGDAPRLP